MPITDDVIISAIVIASCQIDEISNCPEIIEFYVVCKEFERTAVERNGGF